MDKVSQKNFQEPLLKVLARASKMTADTPVYFRDILSDVCAEAQIPEESHGFASGTKSLQTHRWIGFAFRELVNQGLTTPPSAPPKKGRWCLTPEGLERAASLLGEDPPLVAMRSEDPIVESTAGSTPHDPPTTNVVHLPVAHTTYAQDPYLRTVAISQTACFGAYSDRSEVCSECHLNSDCIRYICTLKSQIASRLRKGTSPEPQKEDKKAAKKPDTIESLMEDLTSPGAPIPSKTLNDLKSKGWQILPIQTPTRCRACQKTIAPGDAAWKPGAGMHHLGCV